MKEKGNSFEETIQKLEEIVKELESDKLDLDASVTKFEQGMQLSKQCSKILDDAEKRISVLINTDGEIKEQDFIQTED